MEVWKARAATSNGASKERMVIHWQQVEHVSKLLSAAQPHRKCGSSLAWYSRHADFRIDRQSTRRKLDAALALSPDSRAFEHCGLTVSSGQCGEQQQRCGVETSSSVVNSNNL